MEKYYIMVNGEQQGPFTNQEIINKGFSNDSYIYNKTLGGWKKISEVADFLSSETEKDIKLKSIPKPRLESKHNQSFDKKENIKDKKLGLKKASIGWVIVGFILSILGGWIGVAMGFSYAFGKYDSDTKAMGWGMAVIGIISLAIWKSM